MNRATAFYRHALHYFKVAREASIEYRKGSDSALSALSQFDENWPNIRQALVWCTTSQHIDNAIRHLAAIFIPVASNLFFMRVRPSELRKHLLASLHAAQVVGNILAERSNLSDLGSIYSLIGMQRVALAYHEETLALDRNAGVDSSSALGSLAMCYRRLRKPGLALQYYDAELREARQHKNLAGEIDALNGLGLISLLDLNLPAESIQYFEATLSVASSTGNLMMRGVALGNLGIAHKQLGDSDRALHYYREQLSIVEAMGDQDGKARCVWNMAVVEWALGRKEEAFALGETAIQLLQSRDNPFAHEVKAHLDTWRST